MRPTTVNRGLAVVAAAALTLALTACSGDDDDSSAPTSSDAPTTVAEAGTSTTTMADAQTVVDVAAANADFSTLVSAVKAADLASTLSGAGPFTVFAPTNQAFAQLPAGTVEDLLKPENKAKLAGVLTYHVVPGKIMAADVEPGQVKTVNGADFTVNVDNGTVTITDANGNTAKVVKTDIAGSNGVIHVIDRVLLPPQ
jgi:uncharacterized surface protein with fasciclin (FAS1) repeats